MHEFRLQEEFKDAAAERCLIATVNQNPALFWELDGLVLEGAFCDEADAWKAVGDSIRSGQPPPTFDGWTAASDPKASAQHLNNLFMRRIVARELEEVAQHLYDKDKPAVTAIAQLEESASRARSTVEKTQAGGLLWAAKTLVKVMSDAEGRQLERECTGLPVMGLPTGIQKLDEKLGGLYEGLYLLGGPPGMGKTSLALQVSGVVARKVPVIFSTFENSAENLTLKAVCGRGQINTQDVSRGTADLKKLRSAATAWESDVAPRLAFIEGTSSLSVPRMGARAAEAMSRHKLDRCLLVVDYLQLFAKAAEVYRKLDVRSRVEAIGTELRELAMRLRSPVLAISSQNREQGGYGDGTGRTSLDSLKESGDLEYMCDVAMFLVGSKNRSTMPPARAVELSVKKNRHGETGLVQLVFRPDISRFREEEAYA